MQVKAMNLFQTICKLISLICLASLASLCLAMEKPLSIDKAFAFSAEVNTAKEVVANWKIAPDYYLYVKKVKITFADNIDAKVMYPQGVKKQDSRGEFFVYAGHLSIPVYLDTKASQVKMMVDYQGCSAKGFCYPPVHKVLNLDLQSASLFALKTNHQGVLAMLEHEDHSPLLFLVFIGLGLLLAFTPCVLPMVPILTGIVVGQDHQLGTRKAFLLSLAYVLGMAITYAGAGLAAAYMGHSLQVWLQTPWMIALASLLFILLGLSLLGLYELRISRRWQHKITAWSNQHKSGTYFGVFCMGVLSTLIVSPCVTAPLAGVLIYIGETGNLLLGAGALFCLGLGMGLPLLLIGTSAGKWLPKAGVWMNVIKKILALCMLAMGVWLFSRLTSTAMTAILWGVFLIGAAIVLSIYLPRDLGRHKLHGILGFLCAVAGVSIIFCGTGMVHFPLLSAKPAMLAQEEPSFYLVKDAADLAQHLEQASLMSKPVLLDFYADWCESCLIMEKKVFQQAEVKQALKQFVLLRVDLTQNTAADNALMQTYQVVAPPTIIFFSADGQELKQAQIIGELSAEEFLKRLSTIVH